MEIYDVLGSGYHAHRSPDPRIARMLEAALGDARSVVNVGAGPGSYEPRDRAVVAVEPSMAMIRQRPLGSAIAVRSHAETLPFRDRAFDAAMAVLTIHHWTDWAQGVRELRRVANRVVILTWDPEHPGFWLVQDYLPDLRDHDRTIFPKLDALSAALGGAAITCVPIPRDCTDGFLGAYWARPERYLDPAVRQAISSFARVADVATRLARLGADLGDGTWARRYAALATLPALDLGYRLVVHG